MRIEPPLTWSSGLLSWELSVWDGLVVLLVVGYLAGVIACRRRGGRWPLWRTGCFLGGALACALAVNSAVGVYSDVLFSVHMAQHLTLIMLVPVLLAFGHPMSLWVACAATPERARERERVLGSRIVGWITHPAPAFVFYAAVLVGTHLTSFLQIRLENPWLEHVEIALYLVSGYLLFVSVVGGEPIRWRRVPYLLRVVLLMVGMLPDTLVGVVLMMTPRPVAPAFAAAHPGWGPTLAADQQLAGAIMWFFGDAGMAALAVFVVGLWLRSTGSDAGLGSWLESARSNALSQAAAGESRSVSGSADDVDSDDALAAYNAMLARLNDREGRERPG